MTLEVSRRSFTFVTFFFLSLDLLHQCIKMSLYFVITRFFLLSPKIFIFFLSFSFLLQINFSGENVYSSDLSKNCISPVKRGMGSTKIFLYDFFCEDFELFFDQFWYFQKSFDKPLEVFDFNVHCISGH